MGLKSVEGWLYLSTNKEKTTRKLTLVQKEGTNRVGKGERAREEDCRSVPGLVSGIPKPGE